MKRETFCLELFVVYNFSGGAFSEGIASILADFANYPISRFNLAL